MGVWNSRHRDVDRDIVLLGRSQENGARAAGGTWLFARNFQSRRSHHSCPDRDGLCFYFGFLGTLGDEQRRGMDVASGENESALDGHGFDCSAGADGKSHPDSDFYSAGQLPDLSGNR